MTIKKRGFYKVEFIKHKNKITNLLNQGYNLTLTYEALKEENQIQMSYQMFIHYAKRIPETALILKKNKTPLENIYKNIPINSSTSNSIIDVFKPKK